jgi:hypothetical protein
VLPNATWRVSLSCYISATVTGVFSFLAFNLNCSVFVYLHMKRQAHKNHPLIYFAPLETHHVKLSDITPKFCVAMINFQPLHPKCLKQIFVKYGMNSFNIKFHMLNCSSSSVCSIKWPKYRFHMVNHLSTLHYDRDVTPYHLVDRYQCFGVTCCLYLQGRNILFCLEGPRFLKTTGIYLPSCYLASHPRWFSIIRTSNFTLYVTCC